MKFLFDMVHHNPAEPLTETKYSDPSVLKRLGYNGQVLKNINLTASYDRSCPGLIGQFPEVSAWIEQVRRDFDRQAEEMTEAGMGFYSHIDPFIIPSMITERYRQGMFDGEGISIYREKTREIMEDMLEEVISRYPSLEGLIIRTGETYLFDTPHHTGNNPIRYFRNGEHAFENGDISVVYRDRDRELRQEKDDFVYLINFLKEGRLPPAREKLFFRTWDIFEDRFHGDPGYYLDVTGRIESHEGLYFSLKHTRLDFLRRVEPNPAIGQGKHKQIIEVQFQREYEGKGAYPNYFAHHLIDGFPETETKKGFRDFIRSPLVEGLYGWSRGGGWYGPYIPSEFWIDLNLQVMIRWLKNPGEEEERIFRSCLTEMGFDSPGCDALRQIALLSPQAVLKGRYCSWGNPDKLWMRDDVIGGMKQLAGGFGRLEETGQTEAALKEKEESVRLWEEIVRLSSRVTHKDESLTCFIRTSCLYGLHLFRTVEKGWKALLKEQNRDSDGAAETDAFEQAWSDYRKLENESQCCPTLYRGQYWNWPGEPLTPGMEDSIRNRQVP